MKILTIIGSPRVNGNTHLSQKFAVGPGKNGAEVLSLPVQEVVTTKIAMEKGLGVRDLSEIEVLGERIEDVRIKGFNTPKGFSPDYLFVKVLSGLFSQSMAARPMWIQDNCSECGT